VRRSQHEHADRGGNLVNRSPRLSEQLRRADKYRRDRERDSLEQQFGSIAAWQREFIALAQALSGRSGWVVLSYGRQDGRLYNQIAEDGSQTVIDAVPLVVLDMYEYAYHQEFGANATAYIDAFMRNVDWMAIANRLTQPVDRAASARTVADHESISVEELATRRASGEPLQMIDTRPRFHISRSSEMIEGAVYRDPDCVHEWSHELAADKAVVVYCAYGFNVGCAVAAVLRQQGLDARFHRLHGHQAEADAATQGRLIRWARWYDLTVTLLTLGRAPATRERTAELAALTPGESVLEVGCGTGELSQRARMRVGPSGQVWGIDPSAEMIAVARGKASARVSILTIGSRASKLCRSPMPVLMSCSAA